MYGTRYTVQNDLLKESTDLTERKRALDPSDYAIIAVRQQEVNYSKPKTKHQFPAKGSCMQSS